MTAERTSRLKKQAIVFIIFFILAELFFRGCCGWQPGTWFNDLKMQEKPEYEPRFTSDNQGINHILRTSNILMPGTVINRQGFRDTMDYTPAAIESLRKNTGKEVVMVIGDSYVEGCCPDNMSKTFTDIVNRTNKYAILNLGVAGTDPLQYELVAKKYIPLLKPDRVLVVVYFGNDLLTGARKPTPGVPILYPFKNNKWIYSVAPAEIAGKEGYTFKSADEAYQFYIDNYTLRGHKNNLFEKTIGYSVILSKVYLGIRQGIRHNQWQKIAATLPNRNDTLLTYEHLRSIKYFCDSLLTPAVFIGIPQPREAADAEKLRARYQPYFKDLLWSVPYNLTLKDYDGMEMFNHFNNEGSKKYADFLEKTLDAGAVKTAH
ncbi:hypothetical protein CNR22_04075 [Sphingobacteriaceae bacterium]|nr:hypothetical protein CNR22_04075 [Sphingobacteriaceae bacterium]